MNNADQDTHQSAKTLGPTPRQLSSPANDDHLDAPLPPSLPLQCPPHPWPAPLMPRSDVCSAAPPAA